MKSVLLLNSLAYPCVVILLLAPSLIDQKWPDCLIIMMNGTIVLEQRWWRVQLCNHYHIPDLLRLHESWHIYDASFCLSVLRQIISKRLPQQQLNTLIFVLFEGLVDSQSNCSRASSVILNTLLKNRGAMLQDLVMILTGYIKTVSLKCFPSVSCVNECKELLCSSLLISLHVCVSGARDVGGTAHSVTGHLWRAGEGCSRTVYPDPRHTTPADSHQHTPFISSSFRQVRNIQSVFPLWCV